MSVLSTGLTELGSSKDAPAPENSLLDEEMHLMNPETRFCRILNCFEFRSNGILINLNLAQLRETDFQGLEVIGAMAVMWGKSGMFAQAYVRSIEIRKDIRFRKGANCVWVRTMLGDYALTLPHPEYFDLWQESALNMGAVHAGAVVEMWERSGPCPDWWETEWKDHWPFDTRVTNLILGKRRASIDLAALEEALGSAYQDSCPNSHKDQVLNAGTSVVEPAKPSHEPPSLVHQLSQWVLVKDGGKVMEIGSKMVGSRANRKAHIT